MPRLHKGIMLDDAETETAEVDDLRSQLAEGVAIEGAAEAPAIEEAVEINTIQAAGIIKDSEGHEWTIPAESTEDYDDLSSTNPFSGLKYDKRFEYITEHIDRVNMRQTEGFVPVTRREVGMPEAFTIDGSKPQTSLVHIMDTVMMKTPKVLADRRRKSKLRLVNEQLKAIEPTEEMLARARQKASPVRRGVFSKLQSENVPVQGELTRTVGPEPTGNFRSA